MTDECTVPVAPAPAHASRTAFDRLGRRLVLCAAILCLLLAVLAGLAAGHLHRRALTVAGSDLGQVANILARTNDALFAAIARLQVAALAQIDPRDATAETFAAQATRLQPESLAAGITALVTLRGLRITDAAGRVLATTEEGAAAVVSAAQPVPEALGAAIAAGEAVTRPWRDAGDGRWLFGVVKPVRNHQGNLLGSAVALVDVAILEQSLAPFAGAQGAAALMRRDGVVLARHPRLSSEGVRSLPTDHARLLDAGDVLRLRSALDGMDRLIALQGLSEVPVVAAASVETDHLLAGWRLQAAMVLGGTVLLAAALMALAVLAARHMRSLEALRRTQEAGRLADARLVMAREREHLQTERELEQMRFAAAIHALPLGLCCFDEAHRLVASNRRYAELYGVPPELIHPGITLAAVVELRTRAGIAPEMSAPEYLAWRDRLGAGGPSETVVQLTDGRTMVIKRQNLPGGGWVATHEDVTEQRRIAAQFSHMALHDSLSGLPNRVLFRDRLEEVTSAAGEDSGYAVLLLDLDHFKTINDTLGHSAGDRLLQRVAWRLRGALGPHDLIARVGGDEFGVLQAGTMQPADAVDLAQRIITALEEPFDVDHQPVVVGATIGIALIPQDGREPDDVLKSADLALYRTKEEGRGHYRLYEPEMTAAMLNRRSLEVELRRAIVGGELDVFYQPVVAVPSREVLGYEALMRWRHPERGMISPDTFIPLAEEVGVIGPMSEWMLSRACTEAAGWQVPGRIAVNLSAVQFSSRRTDLVRVIAGVLHQSGLPPHRLELEITETTLLRETETVLATLHALKALGVRIVMDDFGTGFSSLDHLRRFPFDKVKVDRTFIHALSLDNPPVLRALNELCRAFSLHVTAEGVETEEQFAAVIASGYTEAQGYLFGRPAPREGAPLRWGRL